jgi:hypothetical protein
MMTQSQRIGFFINKIFICDMLKRIPKSDISIRPFKAYKNWYFSSGSTEITFLEADAISSELSNGYPKNSIYGQLRAQFYNGLEDNPFMRFGSKSNLYETELAGTERYLSGSAKVLSIPQIYVGEGIKKGSVLYLDGAQTYIDDSNGNLISETDSIVIGRIDNENNFIEFLDLLNAPYTASFQTAVGDFDTQTGTFNLIYGGNSYDMEIISFDMQSGIMVVNEIPFLQGGAATDKIGNVFYTQGLIVITRKVNELLLGEWDLSYKSTETIYEHEYLLIVNQDEFNVSQNPSAVVEIGKVQEYITGSDGKIYKTITNAGTKYIRKKSVLDTGDILDFRYTSSVNASSFAGFEHYELSGSVDSTGSFLSPFITTIGLYDDDMDLVAVAKLPQPIKSEPDIPVNFIIRFDT